MKKLIFLIALCAPILFFSQCKEKVQSNDYTVKVTVVSNPTGAQLIYKVGDEMKTDTAVIVGNKFEFIGISEEPNIAKLVVQFESEEETATPPIVQMLLFLEPGTITIDIPGLTAEGVVIAGTKTNADANKWNELNKDVDKEMLDLSTWYRGLSREEQSSDEIRDKINVQQREILDRRGVNADTFIKDNPDSWFALASIYDLVLGRSSDPDEAQALLDRFTPRLKETTLGQDRQTTIDRLRAIAIGATAPDFTQYDKDGNEVKLSDFRGQWVLIDFWASWCGPCRDENPHVVAAYNQFKDNGFTVLGITLDQDREKWLEAIEVDKLTWAHVSEKDMGRNTAADTYSVTGIPSNFLLNPEGVIVDKNLRGNALIEALVKHIN